MRRYEFHSTLPPELVFAIAGTKAQEARHPYLTSTFTAAERFFYHRDGERLWLTYTGAMPMTGFIPFSATVRAEGTGSVISGGFSVWRAVWKFLIIGSMIVFLPRCCSVRGCGWPRWPPCWPSSGFPSPSR